jgi:phage tail protein X
MLSHVRSIAAATPHCNPCITALGQLMPAVEVQLAASWSSLCFSWHCWVVVHVLSVLAAGYDAWNGLGNRLPGIITGFFVALVTGRTFLIDSKVW